MTDISFLPFSPSISPVTLSPEPTAQLMWRGGRLEQKWIVTELAGRTTVSRAEEWRVVPTDDQTASTPDMLNHDLLERALAVLIHEAISAVECACILASDGLFEVAPVPGTCSPECVEHIETVLDLIRDIEAEVGPTEQPEPDWFVDLVDRRWSLTGEASAPSSTGGEP